MARLSLQDRAARYGNLARGDDSGLSKKDRNERSKLIKAIGVSPEKWNSYSPSTRRKYIAAARRGNTAQAERSRVREVRAERGIRRPGGGRGAGGDRAARIRALVEEARELINLHGNDQTHYDENVPEHRDLLSDEAIDDFIEYYGEKYVEAHLRQTIDSVDKFYQGDKNVGRRRWYDYQASAESEKEDERWWWYHAGTARIV